MVSCFCNTVPENVKLLSTQFAPACDWLILKSLKVRTGKKRLEYTGEVGVLGWDAKSRVDSG